ncbi:MAG: hypothetical protein CMJ41_09135 [Phycisphaerae bacterium]|nr:hypothetical protein [Phycisphaerae bacterium]HBZ97703.1 hypothetical protein [Phycisphaerales bacterium]
MKRLTAILAVVIGGSALADAVHVVGTTAPLPGSEIIAIEGGRVVYVDLTGARRERGVEDIIRLSFDASPELDVAEARLAAAVDDEALMLLLRACIEAPDALSRRWIHRRLVAVHDQRNEYPQAVSHFARLLIEDPHVAWLRIVPRCAASPTTPRAAAEALEQVRAARLRVEDGDVRATLDAMVERLQRMVRKPVDGTLSGFDLAVIRGQQVAVPVATAVTAELSTPDEIDAMLQRSEYTSALNACLAAVRAGDARSMARLLRQTGDARNGLGNTDEAIIAWTRCGLLFPDAATAAPSLAAAAELAAVRWPDGPTSRRLWEEALRIGRRANDEDVVARAHAALEVTKDQGGSRP